MNSTPLTKMAAITSAGIVCCGIALAQQQPMSGAQPMTPQNSAVGMNAPAQLQQDNSEQGMQDRAFVHSVLQNGKAEVQLGQLAEQKGSSPDVKKFGQMMVADQMKMGSQMQQIAQKLGEKEPKGLSKKDKDLIAKLQAMSGAQFDDTYIKAMVKDHKEDLSDFKSEATNTQSSSLKQIVEQDGQVIANHLQAIEQIAKAHDVKA